MELYAPKKGARSAKNPERSKKDRSEVESLKLKLPGPSPEIQCITHTGAQQKENIYKNSVFRSPF